MGIGVDDLKNRLRGQWHLIIPKVTGCVTADHLTGRPCACPWCGGKDRFRYTNLHGDGSAICNQCFRTGNGDALAIIMRDNKIDLNKAITLVCDSEGIEQLRNGNASQYKPNGKASPGPSHYGKPASTSAPIDPAESLEFRPWDEDFRGNNMAARVWCIHKAPITFEALLSVGARIAKYQKHLDVIAIPVWGSQLDAAPPVGWCLYNLTGGPLPRKQKNKETGRWEVVEQLKVKLTYGSKPGIMADLARLRAARVVIKVEGPSDLLGLLSLSDLPVNYAGFTNANGAGERPAAWMLELFANKDEGWVIHDADLPGQFGSIGRTDERTNQFRPGWGNYAALKAPARNVVLPFPIQETHGQDLRDYLTLGSTEENPCVTPFADLLALAAAAELITPDESHVAADLEPKAESSEVQTVNPDKVVEAALAKLKEGASNFYADKELLQQIARLKRIDRAGFMVVRSTLQEAKLPLRSFDDVIADCLAKLSRQNSRNLDETKGFTEIDDCLCLVQQSNGEDRITELCNFTARIKEEIERDDNSGEENLSFVIEGKAKGESPFREIEVPSKFYSEADWAVGKWGASAIIYPGQKSNIGTAIQVLSEKTKVRRTVFTHTGWRFVGTAKKQWVYLHADGAVGLPSGFDPVNVDLPGPLSAYRLPDPQTVDLAACWAATQRLLFLSKPELMFSLVAAPYRAVIGNADFSLHLVGATGVFKSQVTALIQQHFGAGMDSLALPGSWSSTANALEAIAFHAKDAILSIDDFVAGKGTNDHNKLNEKADRVLRAQGNHSGRQRLSANSEIKQAKPPQGLIVSTGEDTPEGQSLRARMLIHEIQSGMIESDPLFACQADGAAGLYAGMLSGFISWLAPQYSEIKKGWRSEMAELRSQANSDGRHARTPGIVADLSLTFRYFTKFASEKGLLSEADACDLQDMCWSSLLGVSKTQATQQAASDPVLQFLGILSSSFSAGRAHLTNLDGTRPERSENWGWQIKQRPSATGCFHEEHIPCGDRIGWVSEGIVYLEPNNAFATVEAFLKQQTKSLGITLHSFKSRLHEKGILADTDLEKRKTYTKRITTEGKQISALWIDAKHFGVENAEPVSF